MTLVLCEFNARLLFAGSYDCVALNVPGNPTGINNAGVIVGSGNGHGFIRDAAGNVTTIDYPGTASGTQLFAINNNGIATGQNGTTYFTVDLSGNFHTLTIPPPYNANPLIYGINDDNVILGSADSNPFQGVMFLLHPDGTATPLQPPVAEFAGSLNNSYQYLSASAPNSRYDLNQTYLVNPDGSSSLIFWNGPGKYFANSAFGLNNAGTVVGYAGTNPTQYPFPKAPWAGFVRDPSGIFSGLQCNGLSQALPNAINDHGLIVGTAESQPFLATPVPGTPKLQYSVSRLTLPPMLPTGRSAPGVLIVTNVGDARLDLGSPHFVGPLPPFGGSSFQASECMNNGAAVAGLNPGESCSVTVIFTVLSSSVNDTLYFDDSSSGSPHSVPVSALISATSPLCQEYGIAAGPPRQANFVTQDNISGLASIVALTSINAEVTIPSFPAGIPSPVVTTAAQVDPAQPAQVQLQITTQGGVTATCSATFGVSQWAALGGAVPGKIAVASNGDGRLQAFVRGVDNGLWTIVQTPRNGGWSGWQSLGGAIDGDPAVGVNADGRLEVFSLGTDNSLWHISQVTPGGAWSSWDALGGILTSSPAVATNANGRLQVFGLGTDNALWTKTQTSPGGPWSDWSSLGGARTGNPSVAVNNDGRLEVFARGADSGLWHISQVAPGGDWSPWARLQGTLAGDPVPILKRDGLLEVFARGADDQLWHIAQTTAGGNWSEWIPQGGVLTSDPAVIANSDGHLEVFVRGAHLGLWHIVQTSPGENWSDWGNLGGILANGISVDLNFDGRVIVWVAGSDQSLWILQQAAPGHWN